MMARPAQADTRDSDPPVDRLHAVLCKLAEEHTEFVAQTFAPLVDNAELLNHVIRLIDETVLPRQYSISCDGKVLASFVAMNRRLADLIVDGTSVVQAEAVEHDADSAAWLFVQGFSKLTALPGKLLVCTDGRASNVLSSSVACSAAKLAELGSTLSDQNRMSVFFEAVRPALKGWLINDPEGGEPAASEDKDVQAKLCLVQDLIAQVTVKDQHSRLDRGEPRCFAYWISPDLQAIVARDRGDYLIGAIAPKDMVKVMGEWQKSFGSLRIVDATS